MVDLQVDEFNRDAQRSALLRVAAKQVNQQSAL